MAATSSNKLPPHVQAIMADIGRAPAWREPPPDVSEREQRAREQEALVAARQRIGGLASQMAANGISRAVLAVVLAAEAERQLKLAERLGD